MPIPVICTCGKEYKFKDEFAGRRAKCPSCGNVMVVPGQRLETTPPVPAALPATAGNAAGISKPLLYGGLALVAMLFVLGAGFISYFVFFGRSPTQTPIPSKDFASPTATAKTTMPSPAPGDPAPSATGSQQASKPLATPGRPTSAPAVAPTPAPTPLSTGSQQAPQSLATPSQPALPIAAKPAPTPTPSGPAWARMLADGFLSSGFPLSMIQHYGSMEDVPEDSSANLVTGLSGIFPNDRALTLDELQRKYGKPLTVQKNSENGETLHLYGPLGFWTGQDGQTILRVHVKMPLMREIKAADGDVRGVGQRHLKDSA